jgi:hypothetical protein
MNDLTQQGFDYSMLPGDLWLEVRAAAERVKMRLKRTAEDIVEIGRELTDVKERLPHGQFLPWIEAEFQMSDQSARRFMQAFDRFGKSNIMLNFNPTVLYQLAAPSTPDEVVEKATEKAEAGDKVTVEDVKRWKAEAEQARTQAKELQICAMQNQAKAESLRESLEAAQAKIDELSQQEPQIITETVTKEILPPDYEATKEALERATSEAAEAKQRLKDLKKKHEQEVAKGVQDAIKLHEKELKDMESRRDYAEQKLDELNAHIEKLGKKAQEHEWHDKIIDEAESFLISFAPDLFEISYLPETHDKWLKLAKNFRDAGQAIELLIAEKSGRSLDDRRLHTCGDNAE